MKTIFFILISFFTIKCYSQIQTLNIEQEKTYGGSSMEFINSIILTFDGGYLLQGTTSSNDGDILSGNHGLQDIWLVKTNSVGTIEWEKTYGGTSGNEYIINTISTSDSGYVIGCYTQSNDGDIASGNLGLTDYWLIKTDSVGEIEWERTFGGSSGEYLASIQTTSDGGYLLGGSTDSNNGDIQSGNHGLRDVWLVKTDHRGIIEWEKTFGGSGNDNLQSILATSDSGYLLKCNSNSNNGDIQSGNYGQYNCWLVKINNIGTIEWEEIYGGSNGVQITSISTNSDGGYFLGGYTTSSNGDIYSGNKGGYDTWAVKIDSVGTIEWEKTYGGYNSDLCVDFHQTSDGGYIMGGTTESNDGDVKSGNNGLRDYWLIKTDSVGEIVWEKTYGGSGSDSYECITPTSDGGYFLVGTTLSNDGDIRSGNHGGKDYWMIKTNELGEIESEKTFGGYRNEQINRLIIPISCGRYILGGETASNNGDILSGNHGGDDFWIVKIGINEFPLQSLKITDTIIVGTESNCYNAYDTITVAGSGTVIFESGSSVDLIAGKSIRILPGFYAYEGSFMNAQITSDSTFCDNPASSILMNRQPEKSIDIIIGTDIKRSNGSNKKVKLYPNPNDGQFTIELKNFENFANVTVCNIIGSIIYNKRLSYIANCKIDISNNNKGIYFVKVTSGKELFVNKIIVN